MAKILRQDISSVQGSIVSLSVGDIDHAGVDLLPTLYQRSVVSMLATEVWLWFWAVLLVIWARKLYIENWP